MTYVRFSYLKTIGWKGFVDGEESGVFRVAPLARLNVSDGMATPLAQEAYQRMFSVLGGTIAFSLGLAIGGENVIRFFEQISFGPVHLGTKARQALELYSKYDFWAIAISALTPVPYMLFSWVGGMAKVSLLKFVGISLVFRTMRFGGEALVFYFFGKRARRLIEKYFNIATVVVIILLMVVVYVMKKIGDVFAG